MCSSASVVLELLEPNCLYMFALCESFTQQNCLVFKPSLDSIKVIVMLLDSGVSKKAGMMKKLQNKPLSYKASTELGPKCVIHSNQLRI